MAEPDDEEATGEEQVANSPRERKLELAVTALLAFSALTSALCAYQASRFGGDQSFSFAAAQSFQVESAQADNRVGQQTQIDIGTFQSWVNAVAEGNDPLADFYRVRLRPEFTPAFDAWLATKPLESASAPKTPLEMPEVRGRGEVVLVIRTPASEPTADRLEGQELCPQPRTAFVVPIDRLEQRRHSRRSIFD